MNDSRNSFDIDTDVYPKGKSKAIVDEWWLENIRQ